MSRWWQRGAWALVVAWSCWFGLAAPAGAGEQINAGANPWLDVQLQSGTLIVKTWDRPQVSVMTDGKVNVRHVSAATANSQIPHQYTAWSQNVPTDRGDVKLPEESFVVPRLSGGSHDAVVARGQGNTTIMIPRGTALVTARVGTGQLNLNDYHGVFIGNVANGGIALDRVTGSGYLQAQRGTIEATSSSFDRLRARTATGNMYFRGCTSHQIEATSNYGSIVYDNGRFQPGLARFESEHGNVALGVRGSAQIGAHSGSGHIVSSFRSGAATAHGGPNTTQETVRGGGPVVTAVSKNGSVYLYNGSVRSHPRVQSELRSTQALPAHGAPAYAAQRYGAPAQRFVAPRYAAPQQYAPPQQQYAPSRQAPAQRQYAPPPPPPQQQQGGGRRRHHDQPPF